MSKIERALAKSREERGKPPVSETGTDVVAGQVTGTAVVGDRVGHALLAESISRMTANESRMLSASELSERGIIHPALVQDPVVQALRGLRTKIVQQRGGQNGVILVCGVKERCGSSFIAQNLGAAFAFDMGKTALVIDCNFRSPSVHRLTADASVPGLIDYLEIPDLDIGEIIQSVGIPRFRAVVSGGQREIPAEYFTSLKMRRLIDSVGHRYGDRFVILDGPPTSESADVQILSEMCDYVIVVARYGYTTNTQIANSLGAIDEKKLLAVVFNDAPCIPRKRRKSTFVAVGGEARMPGAG